MAITWTREDAFEIGGIEYVCCPMLRGGFRSEPGRFCLVKPRSAVESYERMLHDVAPRRIVEVGTFDGASTALLAEIARPEKLVGIDRRDTPSAALADFVVRRGFERVVSAHYGVDQGNSERLNAIVASDFGGQTIDLVVDDASHLLQPTRRTFNCLFPHVRPGGTYLIEDWWWAHANSAAPIRPVEVPLTVLVFELILACAYEPRVVARVTTDRDWVAVVRGDADLDADSFDISEHYGPRGRALVTPLCQEAAG
jgi:hypothetical protein